MTGKINFPFTCPIRTFGKDFSEVCVDFHVFLYDWKAVLFIFCIRISFSGRSLLTGLFVASPRYPPGFSLLSLTLYAPAMPEERYDDFS